MSEPVSAIDNREAYYDTLFQGELPYEPLPEAAEVGIAGLCRITYRGSGRPPALRARLAELPAIISTILVEHDQAAIADDEAETAVFGFVDEQARDVVSGIVADVFKQWEVTYERNKLGPLLTGPSPDQGLVIETAAAVMKAGRPGNGFNLREGNNDRKIVAKLISMWGPEFVCQWSDGTILSQWVEGQQLPPEEEKVWLETFTLSNRRRFAAHHSKDPLQELVRVKFHLEETLTDANIAKHLGCMEEEAAELFTPGIRKHFAVVNKDPLAVLHRIKDILETVLTPPNIAERLGWTEEEVTETFNPGTLRQIARASYNDPLGAVQEVQRHLEETLTDANIAKKLGWPESKVAEIFIPSLRKRLAVGNIKDPLRACQDWVEDALHLPQWTPARNARLARMSRQSTR